MIVIDHDMDASSSSPNASPSFSEGQLLVEGTPEEIKTQRGRPGSLSRRGERAMSLLEVSGLNSYYGDSHILFDVGLRCRKERSRRAAGPQWRRQETTLMSLMGMVSPRAGSISSKARNSRARRRIRSHAPACSSCLKSRRVFGSLDVEENIILASLTARSRGR